MITHSQSKQLIVRALLFLFLFIVASGITGSWIVGSILLYGAGFWIYGNMGKMVLIIALVFPFLIRDRFKAIPYVAWKSTDAIWLIVGTLGIPLFFSLATNLLQLLPHPPIALMLLTHATLLFIPLSLLLGVLGYTLVHTFVQLFMRELFLCFLLAITMYFGIFQAWKLWPIFSHGVLTAVSFLFSLTFPTRVIAPTTLIVNTFAVRIEQACSGLDSLFMFSALYLFIGIVDWKNINKNLWALLYIPTAIGLYIVNIFRVYLIVLVGALWSPKLALELFHTYAGMILFILYFVAFVRFIYPKIQNKSIQ